MAPVPSQPVEPNLNKPSALDALLPILALIAMLAASVSLFADDSSYGPNQIALLLAAGIASIIAIKNGFKWEQIEDGIVNSIKTALGAILVLLMVGSLIGTWLLSGVVPTMVYYGLQIMDPGFFYAATCLICAVVSLSIGSSWTTAATIGVAMIGVAGGLGLSIPVTAGAIISGAYFGDKMSPLSDTTILAPAVSGSDLFDHIRGMMWTAVPSLVIALVIFTLLGLNADANAKLTDIEALLTGIESHFNVSPLVLMPLVILLGLAIKRIPAVPSIATGALFGGLWAWLFQGELLNTLADGGSQLGVIWTAMFDGVSIETGNTDLNDLVSGGGMSGMMNTVWLIMCAMTFGGVMEKAGLLKRFLEMIIGALKSTGALISGTLATSFGANLLTGDQYMAIAIPGRLFREEYEQRGLHPTNLSRALEDAGTITSPLIPWNTCGAYMSGVLGVSPLMYAGYCFFNLITPMLAVIYAWVGFKVLRLESPVITAAKQQKQATAEPAQA